MTMDPATVDDQVSALGLGWRREGGVLEKTLTLATFPEAIAYVGRVAELAEEADHHPDIDIRWRTVTLRLTTHSAGGITAKDLALARAIDGLR